MIFNFDGPGGFSGGIHSTGTMQFAASGADWEAVFETSGTVSFTEDPGLVDIFLVANGKPGTAVQYLVSHGIHYYAGDGGAGGAYVLASVRLEVGSYALTLGDVATFVGGEHAFSTQNGVTGKAGGNGGRVMGTLNEYYQFNSGYIERAPTRGTDGIWAYNDSDDRTIISAYRGKKFCAGGSGGDAFISALGLYTSGDKTGGATDGGAGASFKRNGESYTATTPGAGGAHSGSGGGGSYYGYYKGTDMSVTTGAGGSGVLFIRRHREA